jgi:hypothetical protein
VRKSNLFQIDLERIRGLLEDANPVLLRRCRGLAAAAERVPETLDTEERLEKAWRFAGQLKACLKEVRATRIADAKPFADGKKSVDAFFDDLRDPLERALRQVERAMTQARAMTAQPVVREPQPIVSSGQTAIISGVDQPSQPVVGDVVAQLPAVWEAAQIDRRQLDLEALRLMFTDNELDLVVTRWLRKNGPLPLAGVVWREVVRV